MIEDQIAFLRQIKRPIKSGSSRTEETFDAVEKFLANILIETEFIEKVIYTYITSMYSAERKITPLGSGLNSIVSIGASEKLTIVAALSRDGIDYEVSGHNSWSELSNSLRGEIQRKPQLNLQVCTTHWW